MPDKPKHQHYWHYPHVQIQGRRESETVVVRYCACGARQMATARNWREATGNYARDEHYA